MNYYVITKAGQLLQRLPDNDTDETVTTITALYASSKTLFKHSLENPVMLEYWTNGLASNARILSPAHMRTLNT